MSRFAAVFLSKYCREAAASVIVSATSQWSLLVIPLRGVTHPTALCAASRCAAQSAEETGYTAERCNQQASVVVSAPSQRSLLVTPFRSVMHPGALRRVSVCGAERRRDRLHRRAV